MAIVYPLDKTASDPNNYVIGEVHTLSDRPIRTFVPNNAPFYTNNLKVYDNTTNRLMARGIDYELGELHKDATMHLGNEVYQLIIITNPDVSSEVRVNYQVVGGEYSYPLPAIQDLYETILNRDDPIDWNGVINKPTQYPPALHTHWLSDIYGFQAVVDVLERIRNAIVVGDTNTYSSILKWVESQLATYSTKRFAIISDTTAVKKGDDITFTIGSVELYQNESFPWDIEIINGEGSVVINRSGYVTMKLDRGVVIVQTDSNSNITQNVQIQLVLKDNDRNEVARSDTITISP